MEADTTPGCCVLGRLGAFQMINSALHAQADLEDTHQSLLRILDQDGLDPKQLRVLIEKNVSHLQKTHFLLEDCRNTISLRHRPTDASATKAKQVLETAELFEQILLHSHPRDILSAARITCTTYDLFKDSQRLEDKLGIRRSEKGFLYTAFASPDGDEPQDWNEGDDEDLDQGHEQYENCHSMFANFEVKYTVQKEITRLANGFHQNDHRALVEVGFAAFHRLPEVGTRCREMLVFQPVVRVMQIVVNCCSNNSVQIPGARRRSAGRRYPNGMNTYSEEEEEDKHLKDEDIEDNDATKTYEIKSKTGITVGDIYDATLRMRDAHALCPHAQYDMHDENGKVCPEVKFFSDVKLNNEDPYLFRKSDAADAASLEEAARNMESHVLETYIQAKGAGIITLSLF